MSSDSLWYALEVRPRSEGMAAHFLESKGYEYFLPKYQSRRLLPDAVRSLEFPLFPGYVFCKFDLRKRDSVLSTPGVRAIGSGGNSLEPVPSAEIDGLRRLVEADIPYRPFPFVGEGPRGRIERGSLTGLEGFVVEFRNDLRLVLSVNSLERSVCVEIDKSWLRPISWSLHPSDTHHRQQ